MPKRGIELLLVLALLFVLRLLLFLVGGLLLGVGLVFFFLRARAGVGLFLRVFQLFGLAEQRFASEEVVFLRARADRPVPAKAAVASSMKGNPITLTDAELCQILEHAL